MPSNVSFNIQYIPEPRDEAANVVEWKRLVTLSLNQIIESLNSLGAMQ